MDVRPMLCNNNRWIVSEIDRMKIKTLLPESCETESSGAV